MSNVESVTVRMKDGSTQEFSVEAGDKLSLSKTETYTGKITKPNPIRYLQLMIVPAEQPQELVKA
jgi:hypothetical protein